MEHPPGTSREQAILAHLSRGDIPGAATALIRLLGPEILGFLVATHRGDEAAADDAFAVFCEQVWRGIGQFAGQSSLRTWAYGVARNAAGSCRRAASRQARRAVPFSACPEVAEVAAEVRTATPSFLRTERRSEIARLRDELPEEDRELLVLRVDRDLPWLDLARVFLDDEAASPEALQRESARLRKRFQLIKRRLAELGRQRGLLPAREG